MRSTIRTATTATTATVAFALVSILGGCGSSSPLSANDSGANVGDLGSNSGRDQGAASDGAFFNADLKGATCDQIAQQVQQWFDGHRSCTTDGDCALVYTPCGLAGTCGAFVNNAASGSFLDGLEAQWNNDKCMGACPPCAHPNPAICDNGVCAQSPSEGQVGDPCTDSGMCNGGVCFTDAQQKGYVGGYCTLDCSSGAQCPAATTCKAVGGSMFCLKNCDPSLNRLQCRAGYGCCSGPGPSGNVGWCTPSTSFFCTSQ